MGRQVASCGLGVASWELLVAGWELLVASCELLVASEYRCWPSRADARNPRLRVGLVSGAGARAPITDGRETGESTLTPALTTALAR
jgi:hypothetical protein